VTQADEVLSQALELVERDLQENIPLSVLTLNNYGCLQKRLGRPGRAIDYLARALSLLTSATPRAHAREGVDVADIELNTSASLSQLGRHEEALEHAAAAVEILHERSQGGFTGHQKDVRLLAVANYNKGAEEKALGMLKESIDSFRAALGVCEGRLPVGDPLTETVRAALSRAMAAAGVVPPPAAVVATPQQQGRGVHEVTLPSPEILRNAQEEQAAGEKKRAAPSITHPFGAFFMGIDACFFTSS
jgi:tetratricopeptide (TPR) repeat protein